MLQIERSDVDRATGPSPRIAAPLGDDVFAVRGSETVALIRRAVRDGNVLRIWIKDENGRTLIEIPSLLGVRGGLRLAPVWTAVRALAAASGQLTVEVSREPAWPHYAD